MTRLSTRNCPRNSLQKLDALLLPSCHFLEWQQGLFV